MDLEKSSKHHGGHHAGRQDLIGEHKWGDAGQLVLLILFLAIWIPDSFIFHWTDFLSEKIAWYYHTVPGLCILAFAGYMAWKGLRTVFIETRETPHVITKGAFSIVRHPIYLGAILFYLGQIFMTLSLASLPLLIFIVIFYWFISRHEEKMLTERFGDEYIKYKHRIPMLFPVKFR
jgi:protein-S-isoprenylcysteine O-methyltransferase Ste14